MIRLAGSELPTIERRITTLAWPTNAPTGKELRKNRSAAAKAVWKNTKPFTRTREAVESKFRERYQQMLNSIGMTWDPDEPLPKPQVLYEDDD